MHTLSQLQSGELSGATYLNLCQGFTEFPREIFELEDTLEYLDISNNKLTALPADIGRLKKLKILFCGGNRFTSLPAELANCQLLEVAGFKGNLIETLPPASLNTNLRWLILTNNKVSTLPAEIGNCHRLQKLMLAGNQLSELPQELSNCKNLQLLRISANRLAALPEWLLKMPKLSWLAFSGNLFNEKPFVQELDLINWGDIGITSLLGQGASGIIHKAMLQNGAQEKAVAVKVFKGSITSDGFPQDEMDACILAGHHPGLVKLIGKIAGHPEDKQGLIMELIPPSFYNLGLPPDFDTCTRDTFETGQVLTTTHVLQVACTIASIAAQLHDRGIMHSDLYAHNILVDERGNTLFSDFGAACFYNRSDLSIARSFERIEVSAFGFLLDDLIGLCKAENEIIEKLIVLKDQCLLEDVLARPDFTCLHNELIKLSTAIYGQIGEAGKDTLC